MFSKGLAHIACRDRDIALKTNPYVYHIKDTSFFNHHNKDNNRHHPPFLFFHAYNSTSFFSAPFNMIEGVGVYIHTGKRGGGVFWWLRGLSPPHPHRLPHTCSSARSLRFITICGCTLTHKDDRHP